MSKKNIQFIDGILIILGISILLIFVLSLTGFAQSPPVNLTFDYDNHILKSEGTNTSSFYDENILNSVYLEFKQADFWQQLHDCHDTDNYVLGTLTYDGDVYDSIGARFKGQTSYMKIKDKEKLSFAVSLDEYVDGQDIEGYNNLNLNNGFQDPTFMREVLYANLNRRNIPSARANFINLYINDEYWGVYENVQQLNKDFTKEWFMTNNGSLWRADGSSEDFNSRIDDTQEPPGGGGGGNWGDGTAALNYLGEDTVTYQEYYTLKSSEQTNPWDLLVKLTDILNNESDEYLLDSISKYLNVDRTLWFLAHETVFSDDDSYVHKGKMDYYVYYEPETNQFIPLEFDGNSSLKAMNADWSPFYNEEDENYPLMNRLYAIPELRQRYLAHVRSIIGELLDPELTDVLINKYDNLIRDAVRSDPKKLTTFSGYEVGINYLSDFFTNRKNNLKSNSEVSETGLTISSVIHESGGVEYASPDSGEMVNIKAEITGSKGASYIYLYHGTGIVGPFVKTKMFDDGKHKDGEAGDGIYGGDIPGYANSEYIRYYIEAIADDATKTASYSPEGAEHDVYYYRVKVAESVDSDVVINEILASNSAIGSDSEGEFDDWIELYNNSNKTVSLAGYYLSDNSKNLTKWEIQDLSIDPNSYLIIWADEDEEQGTDHANFKLSADGEELFLVSPDEEISDQLFFGGQQKNLSYGRLPNGTGPFYTLIPTFNSENLMVITSLETDIQVEEFSINLYPNPATDFIQLETNYEEPFKFTLFDINGKLVLNEEFFKNGYVDISHLHSGLYISRVEHINGNEVKRLIIK